jgi:hypothetical protein
MLASLKKSIDFSVHFAGDHARIIGMSRSWHPKGGLAIWLRPGVPAGQVRPRFGRLSNLSNPIAPAYRK